MSKKAAVIRLQPHGPDNTGLEDMELETADFQSDLPRQQVHVYYEDTDLGLSVGVWTTTSMQEAFGPYPRSAVKPVVAARLQRRWTASIRPTSTRFCHRMKNGVVKASNLNCLQTS